jgi:RNA-directed DNA polymerase
VKLDLLREKVIKKKFNWKPIKRIEIPKSNGKRRPLGIPTLDDRIVQEVLRTILEPLFEPLFSDKSYGFRPGRSCHTALKYVNTQFKAVS